VSVHDRWRAAPVGVGAGIGLAVFGAVGIVVGFVLGLLANAPTAWAGALELGVPGMLAGAFIGATAGVAATAWRATVARGR
jgi:hypothetical protein